MLSVGEISDIIAQVEGLDLSTWDAEFIGEIAERLDEFEEFQPTARQEEQLLRIKEQYMPAKKLRKPGSTKPAKPQKAQPAPEGHNGGPKMPQHDLLQSYFERIERLDEEKSAIAADIRDIFAEAKANGFDPKTMRRVLRLRKLDVSEREEQRAMDDMYQRALGMLFGDDEE